eukprot:TRINITY_DN8232_c0_g1_i1.p1 TRINITY_DN8232_c0_g1~~TRINITY_DN8232_c0_g1_i1.p1  ORF type:complete len:242 (-),score=27.10 TRINITY_DN8232_c0_g1_i1:10-735(-)
MDFLWRIIALRDRDDTRYFGFIGLAHLLHSVSEYLVVEEKSPGRCQILAAYVNHRFENISGARPLYLVIAELWLQGLNAQMEREADKDTHEERLLVQYSWFFFETIFKSMTLEFMEKGTLLEEDRKLFVAMMARILRCFVALMHRHRSTGIPILKGLVNNLALFMTDLPCVLDKASTLFLMIVFVHEFHSPEYVQDVCDPVLVEFKFTFYSIVFDSEYMILQIGRAVQQECRDRSRMPSSA